MRLEKCHFCSSSCYPGHGTVFVRNDAKVFRFCRSKCYKNFKIKRNPRKMKWTKAFRRIAGKELTVDTCLDFEKKTALPVRYSRALFGRAVDAIKRVEEVKAQRELLYHRDRLKPEKALETEGLKKRLEKNIVFAEEKEKKFIRDLEEERLVE